MISIRNKEMSDWDIALAWISRAKSICDQLKTSTGYRPSEREFQDTLDNCSPDVILKHLKTSNSLGTVMHSIVGHGYVDLVRCALEAVRGEDVLSLLMLPSDTAMTAFHYAASCRDGDPTIMQLLIDSVQDTVGRVSLLKKTDVGRNTALHYAAECGNQDIIKTILSSIPLETAKILIELQNQCNQNIYDIAVQQESKDTIAYLDSLLRQHTISRQQDQALLDSELVQQGNRIQRLEDGTEQHQTEMKAELQEVKAENAEIRNKNEELQTKVEQTVAENQDMKRRLELLERLMQGADLQLLAQIPNNKEKIANHDDRFERSEVIMIGHKNRLDGQDMELKNHEDRLDELEIPKPVQCPDGGESGDELAMYADAKQPTQETVANPR